jgi:hypothetical protein
MGRVESTRGALHRGADDELDEGKRVYLGHDLRRGFAFHLGAPCREAGNAVVRVVRQACDAEPFRVVDCGRGAVMGLDYRLGDLDQSR